MPERGIHLMQDTLDTLMFSANELARSTKAGVAVSPRQESAPGPADLAESGMWQRGRKGPCCCWHSDSPRNDCWLTELGLCTFYSEFQRLVNQGVCPCTLVITQEGTSKKWIISNALFQSLLLLVLSAAIPETAPKLLKANSRSWY